MSVIIKQDTDGNKPLLNKGEFGYDDYIPGGDIGRVYVGTGSSNVMLAKKSEVDAVDSKADAHTARVDNPHGVTKAQVGLGNVDNTADVDKPVSTAQLGLYGDAYLQEMKDYIANVIRINNEAELNGTQVEDVLWQ